MFLKYSAFHSDYYNTKPISHHFSASYMALSSCMMSTDCIVDDLFLRNMKEW